MLTCPFRSEPIKFLPMSCIMNVFASFANLAMTIRREKATVISETSGIIYIGYTISGD